MNTSDLLRSVTAYDAFLAALVAGRLNAFLGETPQ
jgi:hypothetical protein